MAKKREKDLSKVSALMVSDYLRVVTSSGKSLLIAYENLPINLEKNIGALGGSSIDYNQLHNICNAGVTSFVVVGTAINSPGAGILLHFQRLNKGTITVGSFFAAQLFLSMNDGLLRYRVGASNGTEVSYSSWRTI